MSDLILAHRLRLRLSAARQEHAGRPDRRRSRPGDRLSRRRALYVPSVSRTGGPPGGGPARPGHRARRHRRGHGLGQPPLPRVLLRGAHDRRGAAHRQRAPLARAARLHHRPRRRRQSCWSTPSSSPLSSRSGAASTRSRSSCSSTTIGAPPHPLTLDGRLRGAAGRRQAHRRVSRFRRKHAGNDVLLNGNDGHAERRVLQPPPARAAHPGHALPASAPLPRRAASTGRRLHAPDSHVPRACVGNPVRRDYARRQAGLPRQATCPRCCCSSSRKKRSPSRTASPPSSTCW